MNSKFRFALLMAAFILGLLVSRAFTKSSASVVYCRQSGYRAVVHHYSWFGIDSSSVVNLRPTALTYLLGEYGLVPPERDWIQGGMVEIELHYLMQPDNLFGLERLIQYDSRVALYAIAKIVDPSISVEPSLEELRNQNSRESIDQWWNTSVQSLGYTDPPENPGSTPGVRQSFKSFQNITR